MTALQPSDALLAAYRRTRFCVNGPAGGFALRIGQRSAEVDGLLKAQGCADWAYLTAQNPGSEMLGDADNAHRQRLLERWLSIRGYRCYRSESCLYFD